MITLNTINVSPGVKMKKGLRQRLDMMARAKHQGPFAAAIRTAESSVKVNEKAQGGRSSTSYEKGRRFREVLVRTFGIVTDSSGNVADKVIGEGIQANEEIRKENAEKYGDPNPTIFEKGLHVIGEADQVPPFSRRWIFRGPKVLVREATYGLAPFLPWPLSCIAKLINKFRDEKADL